RTGLPAEQIRQLARDLAAARTAAVYGRIGTCRGRHGTLTVFLLDALNIVTGNFDRPGGSLLGKSLTPPAFNKAADTFGKHLRRHQPGPRIRPARISAASAASPTHSACCPR